MKTFRSIIVLLICMGLAAPCLQAAPQWERVPYEAVVPGLEAPARIEVIAKDGYLYVTAPEPVTVKVFSIVGQLISEKKLPAGTSRLKIEARGIYIVRAGDTTLRVTI